MGQGKIAPDLPFQKPHSFVAVPSHHSLDDCRQSSSKMSINDLNLPEIPYLTWNRWEFFWNNKFFWYLIIKEPKSYWIWSTNSLSKTGDSKVEKDSQEQNCGDSSTFISSFKWTYWINNRISKRENSPCCSTNTQTSYCWFTQNREKKCVLENHLLVFF